jgi:nascent polypeptide-associated complex subunit alpha
MGGRVNPRQMKQAMKRMGISTEEINDVEEVIIRTATTEYVIKKAEVTVMAVQGQKTYQIAGETETRPRVREAAQAGPSYNEEDVKLVMEQCSCTREKAIEALKATDGQPAEAILKIMSS